MKKIIIILIAIFMFMLIGCKEVEPSNLNFYIEQLDAPTEVYDNFNLPRVLSSEKDHVITWVSSNEQILCIGNIKTSVGLQYYYVEVTRGEEDVIVTVTATIDMTNGESYTKDFVIIVKEDTTIMETKVNNAKKILADYHNLMIKDSIALVTESEEYNFTITWKSNNENVISSTGVYNGPEVDTVVDFEVVVKEGSKEIYKETISITAINKNAVEKELELDFASNFTTFAANWESSYSERTVTNKAFNNDINFQVIMSRANKQPAGNAISDRPVIATKQSTEYITIQFNEETIKSFTFKLMQWNSKTFGNIHLEYFDGTNWVKCSSDITVPGELVCSSLPAGVSKVRLSVYASENKNVQLGLTSISLELN